MSTEKKSSFPNVRAHPQPGLLLMIIEPKPIREKEK
jgi:hypothetical protein